jgi:putative DNA primase/helicase
MKIEGSAGKGRLKKAETRRWFAPLLSTSNFSVPDLAKQAGQRSDSALLDRLADIPVPAGGFGMFETLHGFADVAAFSVELKRLAAENHGWAGRKFVRRLLRAKKKDMLALKEFMEERRARYTRKANRTFSTGGVSEIKSP